MIKDQNNELTSENNLQEEKKVVRRGRPKKSEQESKLASASPDNENPQPVKTRKPRTSSTATNETKALESSKSKKKLPITPIQSEDFPSQKLAENEGESSEITKKNVRKTNTKKNTLDQETMQEAPKKRGRKPKEIVNLAKDLELSEEMHTLEHKLSKPDAPKPSKVPSSTRKSQNTKESASKSIAKNNTNFPEQTASLAFNSQNKEHSSALAENNTHDSIQLLPTQKGNQVSEMPDYSKNKALQKNALQTSEDEHYNKEQKQNRGLSKNFFKRVPLNENAIKQKETMHNPMLYAAPKQLQGKVQPKKQNNLQPFTHDQENFYPQPAPYTQDISMENQYANWQNARQKPQNKNNNQLRQKNNQNRQRQTAIKNMPQPAFDNSSIIAAISGMNFDADDMYSPTQGNGFIQNNFNQHSNNISPIANNSYNKNHANGRQQKGQKKNTHLNGNYKMPEQAPIGDESSLLHQNMLYQRNQNPIQAPESAKKNTKKIQNVDPLALTKLPSFAQSALEHKDDFDSISREKLETPFYTLEQPTENQEVIQEKKTRGRKKKAETILEESANKDLKMFVSVQSEEQVEVALVKDETVVEYFVEMSHQAKIRGNIYKATIHNVDPNLQAAFINFGSVKNGFLQIDEVHPDYYLSPHAPSKNHKFPLISKVLRPGQELFVQIVKEPTLTKGAFLTTWISLAGRYLVLTPGQEQLGVSRKVSDPEERARLRSMLDGINPDKGMGIIIRTAAANASQEELQADLDYLQKLWLDILEKSNEKSVPALIHQEVELTQRVVRDYLNENVNEIWTNDKEMAQSITKMATILYPQKASIVKLFNNNRSSLWDRFNLQKQIDEISQREVALPSGGRIVFDQTEALMAIDINSGKTQNKSNFHEMVLQTNIEAAQAIARHLRLRDVGGQVVIDFIEVHDKNAVKEIEKAFKNAMIHDRARYEVGHISPFGLLEVIRQRIGSSAISISTEPCPHCNGTGTRRNMEWQAQDALKEIAKKARQEKTIKYVYTTNTELALYLLNLKRDRISELEERFNIRIEIQAH